MSTAHCPGPYTNRHFNRSGSIDIDAGAHKLARVYCRELPGGVCTDEAIAEAEATANLLCAAPDLLAALEQVLNTGLNGHDDMLLAAKRGFELTTGDIRASEAAVMAAQAATSKARGK